MVSAILRMKPDGSDLEVFAEGVRNTRRLRLAPGDARAVVHRQRPRHARRRRAERRAQCRLEGRPALRLPVLPSGRRGGSASSARSAPARRPSRPCRSSARTWRRSASRSTPATCFRRSYKNAAIIAQHGSWNRSTPSGYRVMVAHTDGRTRDGLRTVPGRLPAGSRAAAGRTRRRRAAAAGRPADVLQMPDGSILISDDTGNRLLRVSYRRWQRHHRVRRSLMRFTPPRSHISRSRRRRGRRRARSRRRPGAGPHRGDDQRHRRPGRESHVEPGRHGVLRQHGEGHDLPRRAGRARRPNPGFRRRPPA